MRVRERESERESEREREIVAKITVAVKQCEMWLVQTAPNWLRRSNSYFTL